MLLLSDIRKIDPAWDVRKHDSIHRPTRPCVALARLLRAYTYIDFSNLRLGLTYILRFTGLQRGYALGYSLGGPSDEGVTLLSVSKVLTIEDLEFPVLLDESEDDDGVVGHRRAVDGGTHGGGLHRV